MALPILEQPSAKAERAPPPPPDTPAATPAPTPKAPTSAPPVGTPKTLLVVDDQRAVRASVAYFLEVCGYRTFCAESGQAAIELLETKQIDGVLLDVQMPELNGLETCTRLRNLALTTGRPVKIWFMTGIWYRELKADCARAGGEAVFQKPFDWPQLLAALGQGLSSNVSISDQGSDATPDQT